LPDVDTKVRGPEGKLRAAAFSGGAHSGSAPAAVAGGRSRRARPADASIDLRLLTIKPDSIEGPLPDDSTRPQGVACTIDAWRPAAWYPDAKPDLRLTLTEFPDPAGEAIAFNVPDPSTAELVDDEVLTTDSPLGSP
jgi:hypothetical protein